MKILGAFIFVLIISNSCRNIYTPIDSFFKVLEQSVDGNKLTAFRNASKDSALFYFQTFEDEFFKVYKDSAQAIVLNNFFNGISISRHWEVESYYLCFAFHSKLNCRKFDNDEIFRDLNKEFQKIKAKYENELRLFDVEQYNIMQSNAKRWAIGDTLEIAFPVKFLNGIKSAHYCIIHPNSIDCSGSDDFLIVNSRLLQKQYHTYSDSANIDTNEITFKLKILKLSNPKYRIFDEKYKSGDSLSIHLSAYGKPII